MINDPFSGDELQIVEKIRQRRLQMLVHSYLYYELDTNIVSDSQWAKWAKELEKLQNDYPQLASEVIYAEAFKDWDGSSGAFLPYRDENIVATANRLISKGGRNSGKTYVVEKPKPVKQAKTTARRLF